MVSSASARRGGRMGGAVEALGGLEGSDSFAAEANALLATSQGTRLCFPQLLAAVHSRQVPNQVPWLRCHKVRAERAGDPLRPTPVSCDGRWPRGRHLLILQGGRLAVLAAVLLTAVTSRARVPRRQDTLVAGHILAEPKHPFDALFLAWCQLPTVVREPGGEGALPAGARAR